MNRMKLFYRFCIIALSIIVSILFGSEIVNAEAPEESQFSLLFWEDGMWKDYTGMEKDLDELKKLGGTSQERTVDAWHYATDTDTGKKPHWNVDDKIEIYDTELGDEFTYYNNFNEIMKDYKIDFEFNLPDEVKREVEAGKKLYVTVKAGKTRKDGKALDAKK